MIFEKAINKVNKVIEELEKFNPKDQGYLKELKARKEELQKCSNAIEEVLNEAISKISKESQTRAVLDVIKQELKEVELK